MQLHVCICVCTHDTVHCPYDSTNSTGGLTRLTVNPLISCLTLMYSCLTFNLCDFFIIAGFRDLALSLFTCHSR